MFRDNSIAVVVPAYNESGFVGDVIRDMPAYVDYIYVVDDCSTDDTWDEILTAAAADHETYEGLETADIAESALADGGEHVLEGRGVLHRPVGRVVPIQHHENRGAGGAIKTGYLAALSREGDIVVTVDGDGQMDLEQIPRLLDPIVEGVADYAKGNRLLYREYRAEMPRVRFLGNAILTLLSKIASGYWKTMDPQNGYTAISRYALENVGLAELYEYYGYCNDLLVKLNAKGMRVADVAMPAIYAEEASSISYPAYIRKVSLMLLRNFLWRLKVKYLVLNFHPLALFYFFGAPTAILGAGAVLWTIYAKVWLDQAIFVRMSLSMMLFTMGSMFLLFAMLFDMQVNEDKEVQIHE